MNIITVKKSKQRPKKTKQKTCYSYQVPKYLSKGIAFVVFACVCILCTLQFCPQAQSVRCASNMYEKEPEKSEERERWTDEAQPGTLSVRSRAVRLEPFPKTRAFMRRIAWISCIRPGHLTGCWLFKTGQKSHFASDDCEKGCDVLPSAWPEARCERCGKKQKQKHDDINV